MFYRNVTIFLPFYIYTGREHFFEQVGYEYIQFMIYLDFQIREYRPLRCSVSSLANPGDETAPENRDYGKTTAVESTILTILQCHKGLL